ncbi:nitrogen fixation protein NifX [Rhodobacter sp. Har01]|uniref:nitrogen fixation protein NifX n=1 Tax=Rhodobacter sp. Har01 TaxID=2883999 RepID=UPI001D085CCF|nr:nitrogen fixation protein NifX [Rhodobacter sp. Har01]MCB6178328.1 nitrogen fixation protein NifX [Rhodobacter sp. Har01]
MSRTLRLVDAAPPTAEKPLRIAIATDDMENLNAHFGSARKFAVYEVTRTGARFLAAHEFDSFTAGAGRHDDQDDRIAPKIAALEGCALVFALAIGGPSAARVVKAGVHPIKRKDPEPIAAVLEQVRVMLNGTPPPFLRKALGMTARPDFTVDDEDLA